MKAQYRLRSLFVAMTTVAIVAAIGVPFLRPLLGRISFEPDGTTVIQTGPDTFMFVSLVGVSFDSQPKALGYVVLIVLVSSTLGVVLYFLRKHQQRRSR